MKNNNQQGFVSIFSVMFFALLSTVITIGFVRLMIMEQRQALDYDLCARALSAAEGGVDDAKRAILYYSKMPTSNAAEITAKNDFRAALNSGSCDGLMNSQIVRTATGITAEGTISSDANGLNMYYKCLTVNLDTPDFEQNIEQDQTVVIPLNTAAPVGKLNLQWHLTSSAENQNTNGPVTSYRTNDDFPRQNGSAPGGFVPTSPAFLRVQLVGIPKSGTINREDLEQRSRTVFLVPSGSGTKILGNAFESDNRAFVVSPNTRYYKNDAEKPIIKPIACNTLPVTNGTYACDVNIALPSTGALDVANNTYYLRVTSLYRKTRILVNNLVSTSNAPTTFVEAQPVIDSTGVSSDVFRRVQVRTNFPGTDLAAPRYGVESGQTICKDFAVSEIDYYGGSCTP